MKNNLLLTFCLLSSTFLSAQYKENYHRNYPVSSKGKSIFIKEPNYFALYSKTDSPRSAPKDTAKHNFYGNLINDDSMYNKKYPLWVPALEALGIDVATVAIDRYMFNASYSRIGLSTWEYNMQKGWEWDGDGFSINFFGHPYSGSLTYNTARSSGYNYYQSVPFALGGSLLYEYFGENTRPSYNDLINTTLSGAFLGEILYRMSSNILNDRKTGIERGIRELSAGIIDPARGFNRLIQGKTFRHVYTKEEYQKEPTNFTLYGGVHALQDVGTPKYKNIGMLNLQIDYGNPFEPRSRKPFDVFRLRADFDYGINKVVDNISGYGILAGQNYHKGDAVVLVGGFQYYDYWQNKFFDLAATGLGVGAITKLVINANSNTNLFSSFHLAGVPLAANSIHNAIDTFSNRKYHYGGGIEGKFESTLNFANWGSISMLGYYFWTRAYVGAPQNNSVVILRPRVTIRLYKQLSCGYEDYLYFTDETYINSNKMPIHAQRSEQKIFLLYFFEDKKRYEHYN